MLRKYYEGRLVHRAYPLMRDGKQTGDMCVILDELGEDGRRIRLIVPASEYQVTYKYETGSSGTS